MAITETEPQRFGVDLISLMKRINQGLTAMQIVQETGYKPQVFSDTINHLSERTYIKEAEVGMMFDFDKKKWHYSPRWQLTELGVKALGRMEKSEENPVYCVEYGVYEPKGLSGEGIEA